jgi:predicted amidohydrolase YtcJ
LKGLGVGVDLELERYLDRLERGGGPFFRLLVDSGIDIGFGNDGSNFAPNNPWLMMYYATTGVSVTGEPNNVDQTISRMEALRLFTAVAPSYPSTTTGSEPSRWASTPISPS